MPPITKQELDDAALDAKTMEDVANGSATLNGTGLVTSRLGQQIKTLAKLIDDLGLTVPVESVNGETGIVTLDTSEIPEAGDKLYISAANLSKLAGIASGAEVNVDTNLAYTAATRLLTSSTGTDVTLPLAVAAVAAGLLSASDKSKLDGIEANATADQTNAQIVAGWETETGRDASADGSKLDTIESNAKDDQTSGEIAAGYNAETPQVSAGEKTSGTEIGIRRFSPKDVADMAGDHGGGGGGTVEHLQSPDFTNVGIVEDGFGTLFAENWDSGVAITGINVVYALEYLGNGIVVAGCGSGTDDGDIYRSTDFGVTWTLAQSLAAGYTGIYQIVHLGGGIVVCGTGGTTDGSADVWRSVDYGLTWTSSADIGAKKAVRGLCYCGDGVVLAGSVNASVSSQQICQRSTDYGVTFPEQPIGPGDGLEGIYALCYCGNDVVLAGSGIGGPSGADGWLYRSTNGGFSFGVKYRPNAGDTFNVVNCLEYVGNDVVLMGVGNSTGQAEVYRSTDAGLTFPTVIQLSANGEDVNWIQHITGDIILAGIGNTAGVDCQVYKSLDAGASWALTESLGGGNHNAVYGIAYLGNGAVLASASSGEITDSEIFRSVL